MGLFMGRGYADPVQFQQVATNLRAGEKHRVAVRTPVGITRAGGAEGGQAALSASTVTPNSPTSANPPDSCTVSAART